MCFINLEFRRSYAPPFQLFRDVLYNQELFERFRIGSDIEPVFVEVLPMKSHGPWNKKTLFVRFCRFHRRCR